MDEGESYLPSLTIRIIYEDLPDLIELKAIVKSADWQGSATAYASTAKLGEAAAGLVAWSRDPVGEYKVEAGENPPIRWISLTFIPRDGIGHLECRIALVNERPGCRDESWRMSTTMRTEPGLVERFAQQLQWLSSGRLSEVTLEGLTV
jgi:hypothetical protein